MEKRGLLHDVKVQIICIVLVVIAEFIGIIPVNLGPIKFVLLPMLFALVMGIVLSQIKIGNILTYKDMVTASPYIGISVMYLVAWMGCTIGPNLHLILSSGPALILQEFGNLGTIFLSMPVAVYLLKMDRTCVGSAFSNSREGSLAIIADLYGMDSPEGRGVMGSYITGTLLGTIFSGILASLMLNFSWFSPESLAMATGTGSSSMMSAALAPIIEAFPEKGEALTALAASSQVLSSMDGVYMSLFLALPITEWLYRVMKGKNAEPSSRLKFQPKVDRELVEEVKEEQASMTRLAEWKDRIKVLFYSGTFALIANWIASTKKGAPVTPLQALPAILWLLLIVIISNLIKDFMDSKNLNFPAIMYISLVATIASIPGVWFGAEMLAASTKTIGLLPLCTPILAYAGIATGKDMAQFKKQGFKIIVVTLCALAGTFIGSAVIANIVLGMMG